MIKRIAIVAALILSVPAAAFAEYIVVLKDGKRYRAVARYQIVDGKALVKLTNGTLLQIDPSLIDSAASERATRSGLGNAQVIGTEDMSPGTPAGDNEPSLGSVTRLRTVPPASSDTRSSSAPAAAGPIDQGVLSRYLNAYENVGFYDANIKASGSDSLVVEVVAGNEQQVFNALSATAVLMVRVPAAEGRPMREIDLRLLTLRGSAGRFRMSQADAKALESRQVTPQDWFVRNVIF